MCRREFLREARAIEQQIKNVAMEENPVEKEKILIQILDQANSVSMIERRKRWISNVTPLYKVAMLVIITLFGIFGLSMTSEANRMYMMHRIERLLNGDSIIVLRVDEEQLSPNYSEVEAKKEAEKVLGCTLPTFMYLPTNLAFTDYKINEPIGSVYLEYQHKDTVFSILVYAAKGDSSIQIGKEQEIVSREEVGEQGIEVITYYLEDGENSEYCAKWEYENNYYELHSNLSGDEMKKVVQNIIF